MKNINNITLLIMLFITVLSTNALASAGGGAHLEHAGNNILDQESLQKGAVLFATRCMSCHSVKYMRYNRVAKDLGWTDEEVLKKLGKTRNKVVDNMMGSMNDTTAMAAFGTKIPDLSLMARLKGSDYIYSFLRGFELDMKKGKWDNKYLPGTAMPNIMMKPNDPKALEQYDKDTRDLVNFLEYVGEPAKMKRYDLGWKVMLFLFIMFIFAYLLKREYWKDIKH